MKSFLRDAIEIILVTGTFIVLIGSAILAPFMGSFIVDMFIKMGSTTWWFNMICFTMLGSFGYNVLQVLMIIRDKMEDKEVENAEK